MQRNVSEQVRCDVCTRQWSLAALKTLDKLIPDSLLSRPRSSRAQELVGGLFSASKRVRQVLREQQRMDVEDAA